MSKAKQQGKQAKPFGMRTRMRTWKETTSNALLQSL